MEKFILSIAIPTYNRISYICDNIENIVKQIYDDKLECDICIDVFDNCSTDGTYQYLKSKYKDFKNIFIHSSKNNDGPDINIQRCIYNSSSNGYVWLLSDDDVVISGGIKKIYEKIKDNSQISLFFLNMYNFQGEFKSEIIQNKKFRLDEDYITSDINSFIKFLDIWITFLSSLVINKKYLMNKNDSDEYIGTHFIQTHVALNCLKDNRSALITKDAIVACRGGNTGGYNLYHVWVEQYKKLIMKTAVNCGASPKICRDIFVSSMRNTIKGLVIDVRFGNTRFEDKDRFILFKNTFMYPNVYFQLYPYVFCPKFIFNFIREIRRFFK